MRSRPTIWILLSLLCVAGAWLFWPHTGRRVAEPNSPAQKKTFIPPGSPTVTSAATAPKIFTTPNAASVKTNEFAYRLSNTGKSIGELARDQKAILLENALIDMRRPLNFSIPKNLQSPGDPGAYIVQANGPIDGAFRALLTASGAQIISYIPNNAYLVRVSAGGAKAMSSSGFSVIAYEPYYKISSSVPVGTKQTTASVTPSRSSRRQPTLLELAVKQKPLPAGTFLTLGLFGDGAAVTFSQIEKLGGIILTTNRSPFGLMVCVAPPQDWTALAVLPGVQIVEPYHVRVHANDLSRATTGVAVNSTTTTNYMNLSGSNVIVQVNDSGIEASHPDLTNRVFGLPAELVDTDGHGTFVGGEIAGNGTESMTVTNASGSINPGTNFQYRGKAPLAKLVAMDFNDSDQDLQAGAALTNALISNNSWDFVGDTAYDLEAASYDAATRDALPFVTGSQPVLFVFSAGNSGGGEDDGVNGNADSILSPATAKDVIAVGALEQQRDITNYVIAPDGSSNQYWLPMTDTSFQVAGFSSRGNVGIGTEGPAGRYKPDVVAPGTFVVSTRSTEWNQTNYYYQNPTNNDTQEYTNIVIQPGSIFANSFPLVPDNAIQVTIQVVPDPDSPTSFPSLPIFMGLETSPNVYDYVTTNNLFSIPPDGPGLPAVLTNQISGFNYAVSNNTAEPISVDVIADIITTNSTGNKGLVLSNLNNSIGTSPYYYRYESGTSMSAGEVSGTLALMQDFFTNTLHTTPSPVLLKALLINGARPVGNYNFNEGDSRNYQGWGLINLPNSVPTNSTPGTNSVFYLDQSPTNALATGDSHTFLISVPTNSSTLPLRVTLAWTDPPGNPAAAIKLVNNLDLVVTNTATNIVYYGNDIPTGSIYNEAGNTNAPNLDTINNIENVFLQPPLATNYSITVVGRGVNVNAVTAQSNNVVQDYALVVSCGNGLTPGAITVTDRGIVSNPTSDQLITDVVATNAPLLNQFVGANSPLLGTNTVSAAGNTPYATNALITVGMTNQWHFYIVTNTFAATNSTFTNAAFVTFLPDTLSIPRMGVFADSDANSTTPEADIDLYVATGAGASNLLNLDPTVISNCVQGLNGDGASLSRGGTEFVVYTNSMANQVYYIGVKSETQVASEYAFLPVFTQTAFSQMNPDGSETVNGIPLPVPIPDGSPAHPGVGYVFALALQPIVVQSVVVNDQITHQNIGDLIGTLGFNGINDVLNNHDSLFNDQGIYNFTYDDSQNPVPNSQPSDGPGSLNNYVGQQGAGAWILTEVDDSLGQTGSMTGFSLTIQPHIDLGKGVVTISSLNAGNAFFDFVDVPVGATNLTISVTNQTPPATIGPLQLFVKFGSPPSTTNFDETVMITNVSSPFLTGSISIGPPLEPGRYFIELLNPGPNTQGPILLSASLSFSAAAVTTIDFHPSGPTTILDDAVTYSSILVPNTDVIQDMNVGIRVDHPRISDLVFHLISPDGTRYLLMENRGGSTTNGAGITVLSTNIVPVNSSGGPEATTNVIDTGLTAGSVSIAYNMFTVPDRMQVFNGSTLLFDTGLVSGTNTLNLTYSGNGSTLITVIMNPGGNSNPTTAWTYTVTSPQAKYYYLAFTEDTNLTTTPIKFAPPPFTNGLVTSVITNVWFNGFEGGDGSNLYTLPTAGTNFAGGWHVDFGSVDWLRIGYTGSTPYEGNYYIDLDGSKPGGISTNIPTVSGVTYTLGFAYTENPSASFPPQAEVLINGSPLATVTANIANSFASLNWQTTSFVFTATSSSTALAFHSLDPTTDPNGVFLDAVSLTVTSNTVSTTNTNLYYLPEQDISGLNGQPANGQNGSGLWQLEIQDDRVGAGLTNTLVSWQLEFTFANTNLPVSPPTLRMLANTNINVLTLLTVTNTATPANTNDTLTYTLLNPPAGAIIDTNGVITWTPTVAQGSGDYTITTVVTEDSMPSASATNSFIVSVTAFPSLTNGISQTNFIAGNSITWYLVAVPPNADFATNLLLFASGPLNIWFSTNSPPSVTSPSSVDLISNATNGSSILSTTSSPTNIVPGGIYYLGVQNTNSVTVTNAIEVDFHLLFISPKILISSIVHTNISGTNGFLLTWFAPSNDLFQVQWTPSLASTNWSTFTNIVSYNTNVVANPTNAQFNFFDDGSQTGGFGPTRFYRLILLAAPTNTLTFLSTPANRTAISAATVTVTNTAVDSRTNAVLTYYLKNSPAGAGINSSNGIITWTNATPSGLAARFNTVVTDDSVPQLTATNTFTVFVAPFPSITNVTVTATNVVLQWFAPTNDQFNLQWTTNLVPVINWTTFSNGVMPIVITSTNGTFSFTDTNALFMTEFYRLILLP
jgi:subtilisin-like proprotein convertase family protein